MKPAAPPSPSLPAWFPAVLGAAVPDEGQALTIAGTEAVMQGGVLRARTIVSAAQGQTSETFGFKWAKRDTFEGGVAKYMREWLVARYGDVADMPWLGDAPAPPVVLDIGCGAAMSALALFGPVMDRVHYVGVDVSTAVDVARARFAERGLAAAFIQADLMAVPLPDACADVIFSEGVLHHADDTRAALAAVLRHLKPGGRILFYVYRRKGPIREFTDDYIRDRVQAMTAEEAWVAMMPLTKLGKVLGDLAITVDVPDRIDLLDVPAGPIDLQRLFYWHVFKAFYRPDFTLDEMNHINFDWYAPRNAHRQSADEVFAWCAELGLEIEHEHVEEAGITVVARRGP